MKATELGCGHKFRYDRAAAPLPQDQIWCWACDDYVIVPGTFEDRLKALKGLRYDKSDETEDAEVV